MKYTNILEKLLLIFELICSSLEYMVFIGFILVMLFLMFRKNISKKVCFILSFMSTTFLTIYTIYDNFQVLSKIFDEIMNNIFTNIYFPSIYVYLFILIMINIVGITCLLKLGTNKFYKIINGICLVLINFVLVLILEIISKNNIDLFSKTSLFSNTSLVMLMEFSINIFIVWVISLLIFYLTDIIVDRKTIMDTNKILKNEPAKISTNVFVDELKDEYLDNNNKFIPDDLMQPVNVDGYNYKFIPSVEQVVEPINSKEKQDFTSNFDLSSFIPKKNIVNDLDDEIEKSHEDIISLVSSVNDKIKKEVISDEMVKVENTKVMLDERDSYTLNDYKIFNKMLKDIKEYNDGSVINIDKNLEYRLITKYSTENYDMFKRMLKIYLN